MNEPGRIGLTAEAGEFLEELLVELNSQQGGDGKALIKMDLYRLAVAIGIKKGINPPQLKDKSISSFRVLELDEDGVMYTVLEEMNVINSESSVYEYIERLAEYGIRHFFEENQKTGELPFHDTFE